MGEDAIRIAVLVSGSGSNLQALIDAQKASRSYEIVLVLSDRGGVRALERAERAGVPAAVVDWAAHGDRDSFTTAVCEAVEAAGAEAIVLAGFMRILSAEAVRRFAGRILNIHPALLPSFPGRHPVRDTIAYGAKVTGVTVHMVDEKVDHGPIVSQEAVPVLPGDTEDTLLERLHEVEHRLYPEAVDALARGRFRVEGRTVIWG